MSHAHTFPTTNDLVASLLFRYLFSLCKSETKIVDCTAALKVSKNIPFHAWVHFFNFNIINEIKNAWEKVTLVNEFKKLKENLPSN